MKKRLLSTLSLLLVFTILAAPASAQNTRGSTPAVPALSEHVPGELLIRFSPGLDSAQAAEKMAAMGLTQKHEIKSIGVRLVKLPPGLSVEQAIARFSRMPGVEFAEPNYILHILADPPVEVTDQWGLNKIRAPEAWGTLNADQKHETIIATVDSGVQKSRSDLSSRIAYFPGETPGNGLDDDNNGYIDDTWGWDFVNNDNDPVDDNMHGTAVSSVMVAAQDGAGVAGVCPWCKIFAVKVISNEGSGTLDVVANGITYAADNGAKVINLSVGAPSGTQTLENAVNYAWNAGAVLVAAAGNNGDSTRLYPANYANTITVASMGAQDQHSCFSNYAEDYVSVSAPGEAIYVIDINNLETGYGAYSGTSLATPFVSGLAGLLLGKNPALTNAQVRSIIEDSAVSLGATGVDKAYGRGRIDAYRAVTGDFSQLTPPDRFGSTDDSATGFSNARKLVRDSAGKLHVIWHTFDGSLYRIRYATSANNGVSWDLQPDVFSSPYETYHSALAADTDYLYVAIPSRQGAALPFQVLFARKPLAGGAWSNAEAIMTGNFDAVRPSLYLDPTNGRLHLIASSFDNAPYLYYRASDTQGTSWAALRQFNPSTTNTNKTSYAALYTHGDNIYVVTRTVEPLILSIGYLNIWTVHSIDGGQNWIEKIQIAADLPILTGANTGISLAGIGDRVYMSYVVGFNLYFRRNDGEGWSDYQTLETADANNFYKWPTITQAADGQAWVVFELNGQLYKRYFDGTTWQAKEKIGPGTYPNLKLGSSNDKVEWVYTTCNGWPFGIGYGSLDLVQNSPPLANNQNLSTNEDIPLNITLTGSDPDGSPVTFNLVAGPSHGSLSGNPPNLIYTPAPGYVGQDSFTFRTYDGKAYSQPATVSITVNPIYIHVGDLDAQSFDSNNLWEARVTVTVHDSAHNPLNGVTVNGRWNYGIDEQAGCTTGSNGTCQVSKANLQTNLNSVTFFVDSLFLAGKVYKPSGNHDPENDSYNGTVIIVYHSPQYLFYLPALIQSGP